MPRASSVCTHRELRAIDAAFNTEESFRSIAKGLRRHEGFSVSPPAAARRETGRPAAHLPAPLRPALLELDHEDLARGVSQPSADLSAIDLG